MKILAKIIILLSIFVSICNAQNHLSKVSLISETKQGNMIFASYQDEYQDLKRLVFHQDTLPKIRDIILPIKTPVLLTFNANSRQYPVYVLPGDTLLINTEQHNANYYKFTGRGSKNDRFNFFTHLEEIGYDMVYPDLISRDIQTSTLKKSIALITERYRTRLVELERYYQDKSIDNDFNSFAKSLIKTKYVNSILSPYWRTDNEPKSFPYSYTELIYQSPLKDLLRNQQLFYQSASYRAMLVSYVRFLSRNSISTPDEFKANYRNAADSLHGVPRDYVLFYLVKQNMADNRHDFEKVYNNFKTTCSSQHYVRYIDSLYTRNTSTEFNLQARTTQLQSSTGESMTWQEILDKNKGSVAYVDMWASWCGPCLAEMPHSRQLQESVGDKRVKFIYVSVDNDKDAWLRSLKKNVPNASNAQYYLLSPKSKLATYLHVPPIPLYLLIDKNGVPSTLNAPRPSDPSSLKAILELAK